MAIEQDLIDWANKVIELYTQIAKTNHIDFYTQSDLTKVKNKPKILILGINPGSEGPFKEKNAEMFLAGNKEYFGKRDIDWHFWKRLRKIFTYGGISNLIENESDFVFTNIFHFGTLDAIGLSKELKNEAFVELTKELIRKLSPERVLCFGKKDCFEKLKIESIELIQGEIAYGKFEDIPIYGIPHTSKFYTNEECEMIGVVLGSLFNGEIEHNEESISVRFQKEIKAFEKRRDQIKPENIANFMISEAFKKYTQLKKHEEMADWFYLTNEIIVRVADIGKGYVNIRHSNYEGGKDYEKYQQKYLYTKELREILKKYNYNPKFPSSLGQKEFSQYAKEPQTVVLSIFEELDKLKTEFDGIFKR